jgi:hypothetical protein
VCCSRACSRISLGGWGGGGFLLHHQAPFSRLHRHIRTTFSYLHTVETLCLDGDGSFRANRGSETKKTVVEYNNFLGGDRQVDRIKCAAALASRGVPRSPGAALASRGAGDAGKLCERREPSYDRVSTLANLAPSVLNQIALQELRWIP